MRAADDNLGFQCMICERCFPNLISKAQHIRWNHSVSQEEYYREYEPKFCEGCDDIIPYNNNSYHDKKYCSWDCGKKANWKEGRWTNVHGYVLVHLDLFSPFEQRILEPMAKHGPSVRGNSKKKYVLEHRAVMALEMGRPLESNEVVHHKNSVKDDNRPDNLEVWLRSHPRGFSSNQSMCCPNCGHEDIAGVFFEATR